MLILSKDFGWKAGFPAKAGTYLRRAIGGRVEKVVVFNGVGGLKLMPYAVTPYPHNITNLYQWIGYAWMEVRS